MDWNELDIDDQQRTTCEGLPFTGVAFECFADGRLQSEVSFVEGHEQGASTAWREDGSLADEEHYFLGIYHGLVRGWSRAGILEQEAVYEFGILVQKAQLDSDGQRISVRTQNTDDPTLVRYRSRYPDAPPVPDLTRR